MTQNDMPDSADLAQTPAPDGGALDAPKAGEDVTTSEQILIDALKFYATKEHWMANTENGQPFTLCALKHALDYAGWVHAHGQLQRWAVAKHGENNTPTPPNVTKQLVGALRKLAKNVEDVAKDSFASGERDWQLDFVDNDPDGFEAWNDAMQALAAAEKAGV